MTKKRKSDSTRLDEVDRGMYTSFCSAANSLSQLYSQAMHQHRLSFQAGERHAMEKLYSWILRKQEDGVRVIAGDIIAYVLNELDNVTEEPPQSPRLPSQLHHQSVTSMQPGVPLSYNAFPAPAPAPASAPTPTPTPTPTPAPAPAVYGLRSGNCDQTKNSIFSNALSSPVRRSLQNYHLSQGGHYANDAPRGNENTSNQIRDHNPPSSNDTSMDMHADSPGHDSPY